MFKKDGSSHKDGIANEMNMQEQLSIHSDVLFGDSNVTINHLGGTKNKADLVATYPSGELEKISVKRKKGLTNGSFDYINTSKLDLFNNMFNDSIDVYTNGRKLGFRDENLIEKLSETITNELNNIDSNSLIEFLTKFVVEANSDMTMVITDTQSNVIYKYSFTETPLVTMMENNYKPYIVKSNFKSKKILFTNGEETIDLGLRLRFHLNNGYGAWLGVNGKKTSNLVVKIQQDKIKKLVDSVENKKVVSY